MDNSVVIERCKGFLTSMRDIAAPENIAYQIYAKTPLTEPILALSEQVATGAVATAPITLTLSTAKDATFDIRGTHAHGTLASRADGNYGAVAIILMTMIFAVLAILLFRSR